MLKRTSKRLLSMLMVCAMIIGMLPIAAFADDTTSDLSGHWAESVVEEWMDLGILGGYPDGSVRPDRYITRAELVAMFDRTMHYVTSSANTFSDLDDNWYTDVILKGVAAGVISGYPDGTVRPDQNITREEAAAMFARLLSLDTENAPASSFTDSAAVSAWAEDAVNAMAAAGYINGYNGAYRPADGITRAEVVTIFNNIFGQLYQSAGTYTSDVDGSAVICTDDVILKNLTIDGDLIIAEGVGEGHVELDGVTITGNLIVRGGGENSVIIRGNSRIGNILMERIDGAVRLAVQGAATVGTVSVTNSSDTVRIEGSIDTLNIADTNTTVEVDGTLETLNVTGVKATVDIYGSVSSVDVADGADDATITVHRSTTVDTVTTQAVNTTVIVIGEVATIQIDTIAENTQIIAQEEATIDTITTGGSGTTVSGDGSVDKVEVSDTASDVTVTTPATTVENNSDSAVSIGDGNVVQSGTTDTTPGGTAETPSTPSTPVVPSVTYYTVTFLNEDGTTIATQAVAYGDYATAPTENLPAIGEGQQLTWYSGSNPVTLATTPIYGNTTFTAVVGSNAFAGGNGSAAYPYLVSNEAEFKAIDQVDTSETHYYKLLNSITVTDNGQKYNDYFCTALENLVNCTFDGNGQTITVSRSTQDTSAFLFYKVDKATIKDLNVVLDDAMCVFASATTFNNVDVSGSFEVGGNTGAYVIYAIPRAVTSNSTGLTASTTINFVDCNANVEMIGNGGATNYNAVFVGYAYYYSNTVANYQYLNFTNCTNEGSLICGKASMFLGNVPSTKSHPVITVTNCSNNGLIQALNVSATDSTKYENNGLYSHFVSVNAHLATVEIGGTTYTGDNVGAATVSMTTGSGGSFVHGPQDTALKLTQNSDGTFTITPAATAGVAYYEVSTGMYATLIEGGTNRIYATERIDVSTEATSYTTNLQNLKFVDEAWTKTNTNAQKSELAGNVIYTLNGETFYYIGDEATTGSTLNGDPKAAQMISVSAYDSNGKVLCSAGLSK